MTLYSTGRTARSARHTSLRYLTSSHMRSPFSFGFQSDQVFTCSLDRGGRSTQLPYLSESIDTTGQILLRYK